ncbi:MAG TPA: A/G-specific adenine glycosylase [Bryobacteraceae bacterium]|nr:A/G-specific adenine glycosylase [Bryobacteraceae bacterium]
MLIILVSVLSARSLRGRLARWYVANARNLPWRATRDPYRILVSEMMLQQTRVAAALPYYQRFVERFPDAAALAGAPQREVLRLWGGLGYYSRARNLHRAARLILDLGCFPEEYEAILALPGAGKYTAAAVASIAFGRPHAVVDGNVQRVLSRLTCSDAGLAALAERLLDPKDPGRHNQALMELGALVCLPREPKCGGCPVARLCEARRQSRQSEFPAKRRREIPVRVVKTVLLVRRGTKLLLRERNGFWELPEAGDLPGAKHLRSLGGFRHSIMNHQYRYTVIEARVGRRPTGYRWTVEEDLGLVPLHTVARKALHQGNRRPSWLVNILR